MKYIRHGGLIALIFLLQLVLSNWISIGGIRPDFICIMVLYYAVQMGNFYGVILGFILGFLMDSVSSGDAFGLTMVSYVVMAYFAGMVTSRYHKLTPFYFHFIWLLAFLGSRFIDTYFRYPYMFDANLGRFILQWVYISGFTLGFIGLLQYVIPIRKAVQSAEC